MIEINVKLHSETDIHAVHALLDTAKMMRRDLKAVGWGDTPALDKTISDLEKQLAEVAGV